MKTLIQYVQITAAVYILTLALLGVIAVTRTIFDDKVKVKGDLTGFPALALGIATVICAISTLVLVPL